MGRDGWRGEETPLNKVGSSITVIPTILGGILLYVAGDYIPAEYIFIVVGLCGLIGGAMNVHGRGPESAGAVVGLIIAMGGLGAVYWWLNFRDAEKIWWFEVAIAFVVGAMPGMVAQYVIQKILGVRGGDEDAKPLRPRQAMRRV
jgi:hypothetical protein